MSIFEPKIVFGLTMRLLFLRGVSPSVTGVEVITYGPVDSLFLALLFLRRAILTLVVPVPSVSGVLSNLHNNQSGMVRQNEGSRPQQHLSPKTPKFRPLNNNTVVEETHRPFTSLLLETTPNSQEQHA